MKYVKIKNLNYDYQHYVEQEGLFSIAFLETMELNNK